MKRSSWSIRKRVTALCLALLVVSVVTSVVSAVSVRELLRSLTGVAEQSLPNLKDIIAIQALGLEFRGTSLLMGNQGLTSDYRNKQMAHLGELRTQIHAAMEHYGTSVSTEQRAPYEELEAATTKFVSAIDHFVELSSRDSSAEAGAFWSKQGGAISKAFRAALERNVALNQRLSDTYVTSGVRAARWATGLLWILFFVSAATGIALSVLIIKSISRALETAARELQSTAQEVISASGQVASASHEMASSSAHQATALAEAADSGRQATSATKRSAQHCEAAANLMSQTETSVNQATRKLEEALGTMKDITDSSERITTVIKSINDIALQTNILALNAAVEAARAGSSGLGFAVVADEVRNLAGRCATAAQDATNLIGGSVEKTRAGQRQLDEVAESVRHMAANAIEVKDLVTVIDTDAQRQKSSIENMANALSLMERATHATAAMSEESAAASTQLNSQAISLGHVVESLQALV